MYIFWISIYNFCTNRRGTLGYQLTNYKISQQVPQKEIQCDAISHSLGGGLQNMESHQDGEREQHEGVQELGWWDAQVRQNFQAESACTVHYCLFVFLFLNHT